MAVHDWREQPLGTVATVNPRRDPELRSHGDRLRVTFVPMAAVDEVSGTIVKPTARSLEEVRSGFTPFRENDVIFAKITPCMQNGKSAVAKGLLNGLGFGSTEFHVIRPGRAVLSKWLWYFVRQRSVLEYARRHFRGSAGQRRVPADFLRNLMVPVPGVAEQRRIICRIDECMDRIDEIRDLHAHGIRESNSIESTIFHDFLQDRYQNRRWPIVHLGDLTESSRYGTSKRAGRDPVGIPVLRMGNIVDGYIDYSDLKYADLVEKEKNKYLLHHGDVLINRTNSLELVGKAATFDRRDGEWIYASYLVRIRVDTNRVLPEYVTAAINSRVGRRYVLATARRAIGMVNINAREMAGFPIPLPPLEVQRGIVDRLAEARQASQEIRARLRATDAELLRNAILRRAFAGDL